MKRKSYDRWGIEITSFNRNIAFHVECDCGELAKVFIKKITFTVLNAIADTGYMEHRNEIVR
ncbi:hypothetical protein LOS25_17150 [Enterococcus faecium]|nr:hypothetical protein [Enterococcus faecium]